MTQGLFINGRRPKSKKEVRDLVNAAYEDDSVDDLDYLHIEATSMFGNEFDGPLSELDPVKTITFVGPDPYTKRTFYGNIKFSQKKGQWVVT